MKAMILRRHRLIVENPLELAEVPTPEPGRGEVRIAVRACGICHTDLHTCEGELKGGVLPLIPGHQIVGIVDKIGPRPSGRNVGRDAISLGLGKGAPFPLRGETTFRATSEVGRHAISPVRRQGHVHSDAGRNGVSPYKIGDRVGVAWLHRACGKCAFCLRGSENLCENAQFTGHTVNGGFAEYVVAPADFIYRLPDGFSDVKATPLLCAGIIGYRALRLSEVKPGGRLALYGFGASAHICIQIARYWGCEVVVFTRSEAHQALARRLGAAWAGPATAEDEKRYARTLPRTRARTHARANMSPKADSTIIFAPAGELVPIALRNLEKGGTLALAGIHMSPIPEMDYGELLYHERTIRSVANSTRQDGRELLKLAAEIPIRAETTVFRLEDANRALQLLKAGRITGAGVLRVR
jgi:propanol-preferring alcohol dehydrogenase